MSARRHRFEAVLDNARFAKTYDRPDNMAPMGRYADLPARGRIPHGLRKLIRRCEPGSSRLSKDLIRAIYAGGYNAPPEELRQGSI